MQRATTITYTYGRRLAQVGANVAQGGLELLVGGYPSHGFVIDRKEARTIFKIVESPTEKLLSLCYAFQEDYSSKTYFESPAVNIETIDDPDISEGAQNESAEQHTGSLERSARTNQPFINGNGDTYSSSPPTIKLPAAKGRARLRATTS